LIQGNIIVVQGRTQDCRLGGTPGSSPPTINSKVHTYLHTQVSPYIDAYKITNIGYDFICNCAQDILRSFENIQKISCHRFWGHVPYGCATGCQKSNTVTLCTDC